MCQVVLDEESAEIAEPVVVDRELFGIGTSLRTLRAFPRPLTHGLTVKQKVTAIPPRPVISKSMIGTTRSGRDLLRTLAFSPRLWFRPTPLLPSRRWRLSHNRPLPKTGRQSSCQSPYLTWVLLVSCPSVLSVVHRMVPQATNNVHGHGLSSSSQYQKPNAFVQHAYSTGYDHMGSADYGLSKHTNMAAELVNPTRKPQLIRSLTSSRKHKERRERFNRMNEWGDDRDADDTDWEWHNRYDSDWDSVSSSVSTHHVNEVAWRCRGEYRAVCENSSSFC